MRRSSFKHFYAPLRFFCLTSRRGGARQVFSLKLIPIATGCIYFKSGLYKNRLAHLLALNRQLLSRSSISDVKKSE